MTQFLKFLLIGGTATLVQFSMLALLVELLMLNPILSSATSYLAGAVVNYWANYKYTFASRAKHKETLPKFCTTAAIGLGVNTLLFAGFLVLLDTDWINTIIAPYILAQCLATGITVILNFALHKFWIYR